MCVCYVCYVKFVCVKLLSVKNQKQEPHTKMWGKKDVGKNIGFRASAIS